MFLLVLLLEVAICDDEIGLFPLADLEQLRDGVVIIAGNGLPFEQILVGDPVQEGLHFLRQCFGFFRRVVRDEKDLL